MLKKHALYSFIARFIKKLYCRFEFSIPGFGVWSDHTLQALKGTFVICKDESYPYNYPLYCLTTSAAHYKDLLSYANTTSTACDEYFID